VNWESDATGATCSTILVGWLAPLTICTSPNSFSTANQTFCRHQLQPLIVSRTSVTHPAIVFATKINGLHR
jgi:hypothetical protein